jgi:hypothetical protein
VKSPGVRHAAARDLGAGEADVLGAAGGGPERLTLDREVRKFEAHGLGGGREALLVVVAIARRGRCRGGACGQGEYTETLAESTCDRG